MKQKYKNKLQPFLPLILLSSLTFPPQKGGSRAGFQRDPAVWLPESKPIPSKISNTNFHGIFCVDETGCALFIFNT